MKIVGVFWHVRAGPELSCISWCDPCAWLQGWQLSHTNPAAVRGYRWAAQAVQTRRFSHSGRGVDGRGRTEGRWSCEAISNDHTTNATKLFLSIPISFGPNITLRTVQSKSINPSSSPSSFYARICTYIWTIWEDEKCRHENCWMRKIQTITNTYSKISCLDVHVVAR